MCVRIYTQLYVHNLHIINVTLIYMSQIHACVYIHYILFVCIRIGVYIYIRMVYKDTQLEEFAYGLIYVYVRIHTLLIYITNLI